jgi:hypothetical protein
MSAPWEDYGGSAQVESGPWADYSAQDTPTQSPQPSGFDNFLRQTALQGRAAAQGVVGALTFPATVMTGAQNLVPWLSNKFAGTNYPLRSTPGQAFSQALTMAGAPTPQTAGENLASAATSGLTGGLAGAGVGDLGALDTLRAGASGITGGLSAESARQIGLPPWMQFGAGLLGAQLPAAGESVARTVGDVIAPVTAAGQNRAIGTFLNQQATNPQQAIQNLRSSGPIVPNSLPTAGSASQDIGLLGVEKAMRGRNPAGFGERLSEQNLARQTALGDLAGTPLDITQAANTRAALTEPLYADAGKVTVPADAELGDLLARPSMQKAWKRAQDLAAERGVPLTGANANDISGQTLQYLKMGLNDMLQTAPQKGIAGHELNALQSTLSDFNAWTTKNVPLLRAADRSYQKLSAPVNQMTTLQDLQQRANTTASDVSTGQYFMSPATYSRALDKIKADPFSGVGVGPMTQLEALRRDLQDSQAVNGPLLKAPGSDTYQNLVLNQRFGPLAFLGKPLEPVYKLFGADAAINKQLESIMLDPKLTANRMSQAQMIHPQSEIHNLGNSYDVGAFFGLQSLAGLPGQR